MKDEYTLYAFYLHEQLYAYTTTKDFRDRFIRERNKDKFVEIKRKLNESALSHIFATYPNLKMVEIPLNCDTENYITMIGTSKEESILNAAADDLDVEMNQIEQYFSKIFEEEGSPKKKYENAIFQLTETARIDGYEFHSNINLFHLFFHLFRETLVFRETYDD